MTLLERIFGLLVRPWFFSLGELALFALALIVTVVSLWGAFDACYKACVLMSLAETWPYMALAVIAGSCGLGLSVWLAKWTISERKERIRIESELASRVLPKGSAK